MGNVATASSAGRHLPACLPSLPSIPTLLGNWPGSGRRGRRERPAAAAAALTWPVDTTRFLPLTCLGCCCTLYCNVRGVHLVHLVHLLLLRHTLSVCGLFLFVGTEDSGLNIQNSRPVEKRGQRGVIAVDFNSASNNEDLYCGTVCMLLSLSAFSWLHLEHFSNGTEVLKTSKIEFHEIHKMSFRLKISANNIWQKCWQECHLFHRQGYSGQIVQCMKTLKCFPMSNWKLPRGSFCSSLLFSTHHRVDSGADKAISIESAQGRLRWNISGISPPWNISKLQRTQGISSVRGGRGWLVPNVFHATQKFQLWIWPRPTWVSKIASAFPAFPPTGHPTRMS